MIVMGIDGGGTKTHCYIGDHLDHLLGEGFGGPANYQICGGARAGESIGLSVETALRAAGITRSQVRYAVLGLAGADAPRDFQILKRLCRPILGDIPHVILNDAWAGLRLGGGYGVVSVCGTGGAHAGMNKAGKRLILRNLDYARGNRDGGRYLVRQALHFAFRSDEGTCRKTDLETLVPSLFHVQTMDEVSAVIGRQGVPDHIVSLLPKQVFSLADQGDAVCTMIIRQLGHGLGQYAAGIVTRLGMEMEMVPMVLIGSLFTSKHPGFIEAYIREVRKTANRAYCVIPRDPPAKGACLLALDAVTGTDPGPRE